MKKVNSGCLSTVNDDEGQMVIADSLTKLKLIDVLGALEPSPSDSKLVQVLIYPSGIA